MNELIFFLFLAGLLSMNLLALREGKWALWMLIGLYSLIMNLFVVKQLTLFGMVLTGGNALYGASFLATDMLSEFYGRKAAFRGVLTGFAVMVFFIICTQVLLFWTPAPSDWAQIPLQQIFTFAPRILIASLVAYMTAQLLDVWIFSSLKKRHHAHFLWLRNNLSTLLSQGVDTLIFTFGGLVAFPALGIAGILDLSIAGEVFCATYALKILIAILDTPFLYIGRWIYKQKNSV